jgi:hypothetical protein
MALPRPIAVSDSQLDAIMRACQPLQPLERSAFLAAMAHRLRGCGDLGDGELHRIIREVIREVWRPPTINAGGTPHHNRRSVGAAIE